MTATGRHWHLREGDARAWRGVGLVVGRNRCGMVADNAKGTRETRDERPEARLVTALPGKVLVSRLSSLFLRAGNLAIHTRRGTRSDLHLATRDAAGDRAVVRTDRIAVG